MGGIGTGVQSAALDRHATKERTLYEYATVFFDIVMIETGGRTPPIAKMKKAINKILDSKVPIIIIGIIALTFFSYKNIRYYYHLVSYSEETVARVFDISRSGNARYLDYSYQIGDKEFRSSRALGKNCGKCRLGKYFKLEYSYKDPSVSKLYFDEEITDTLKIRAAGFRIE